jgi:hypothetical protein
MKRERVGANQFHFLKMMWKEMEGMDAIAVDCEI